MSENPLHLLLDARRAKKQGPTAIEERRRTRLAEMVAHARANSPYYRELYRGLPGRVEDPALLPITSKKALMARFDDWSTDRRVNVEEARAFVADPDLVGERFLGKYTVATTSGTTGTRGIFLLDDRNLAVTNALATRMVGAWLGPGDVLRIVARGGRMAMVMATGGHFASAVAAARLRKGSLPSLRARLIRTFPVQTPMPELVAGLNRFRPAVVAPYASTAALLAAEQETGRLRIDPVLLALAAEGLPAGERDRIAKAFDARVGDSYAATEVPFLSYGCAHGWYHVNADWVVLEPVDADHRPVPPGEPSHTVLVSNLANRVQPILRYDLGDSIVRRPDPCPCGAPLPAIRVQGRAADVLTFPADHTGRDAGRVAVAPLAFGTLVDRTPGIELFQVAQTAPATLRVRLRPAAGADPESVWRAVQDEITRLLASHGLGHVAVERAAEPPEQSPGGKYRTIIPLGR
ncbi:phenylacetate--CoA ligase family protein (plasmid) [Rubrobacter tropicus]|uniref:Phenylacetate--CoA ligase family protein n=1 Tax=Rubrobacter tropicus TaxID=2653851 RepID=A0A6G8QG88_9ACTN|nr:phenylacetate--CoA ligase family protein [Rubrobacter tropicus]QIN85421.1 phenylacetate--CoA ligase family protein [Rubrobacter tropicus]